MSCPVPGCKTPGCSGPSLREREAAEIDMRRDQSELRIASLTDALRGLVDRIERVGGYATTEDQLALRQAKQALAASQ